MRTRTLLVLVALALSAGAAQAQTAKPEAPAKAKAPLTPEAKFKKLYPKGAYCVAVPCYVDILVAQGCAKTIPTAAVKENVRGDVIWRIDANSHGKVLFTKKGIRPVNQKTWGAEFDNERPGETQWAWNDLNPHKEGKKKGEQRKHSYRVEVTQDGKTCKLDPIIINDY